MVFCMEDAWQERAELECRRGRESSGHLQEASWGSLLQPRECVRGIKLGRQLANILWRLVPLAQWFLGLQMLFPCTLTLCFQKCKSAERDGEVQLLHYSYSMLSLKVPSPTEASYISQETLPVSLIKFSFTKEFFFSCNGHLYTKKTEVYFSLNST